MSRYQIHFWDEPLKGDTDFKHLTIKAKSTKEVIKYLWKKKKEYINETVKANRELSIWQGKGKTLLWFKADDGGEWYDLDTRKVLSLGELMKLKKDQFKADKPKELKSRNDRAYNRIDVNALRSRQFYNLVMLFWKTLCDRYGGAYIEFYKKDGDEWIDLNV